MRLCWRELWPRALRAGRSNVLWGATLVKNAGFVKGAGCPNSCRVGGIQPLSRREPAPTREGLGLQPLTRRQVFQLGKGGGLNPCQEGGGLQLVKGRGRNPCQEDVCQNGGDPAPKWSSLQTLQLVKGWGGSVLTRERFGGRCPCQRGQAGNPLVERTCRQTPRFGSILCTSLWEVAEAGIVLTKLRDFFRSRSSGRFALRSGGCRALSEDFRV